MARILVIEDDEQVRTLLAERLSKEGYEVVSAADGDAGIRIYREAPADLVITDILMPVKDGVEAIRELRQEFPEVPIIAITGVRGRFSRLPAAEVLGAARTFTKPFNLNEMMAAVASILDNTSAPESPDA